MHRQYNPKRYAASWNNIPLIGFMDGEFLLVAADEDAVTLHSGAQGDTTAVLNANKAATATARLLPGSPANDMLSAALPDADNNRLPTGVFMVKDLNGTTVVHAEVAFIAKVANLSVGKELAGREWMFKLAKATIFIGGST